MIFRKSFSMLKQSQAAYKYMGLTFNASSQFSLSKKQAEIPVTPKVSYPTHEQFFPEGVEKHQLSIPQLDPQLMNKVFCIDHLQEKEQRAAYVVVNRQNKLYHIFDASKMPLGRMCQRISLIIRGKDKPTYKPNRGDCGDQCIIVNAGDILMTGRKAVKKKIFYHTGFVGHLRSVKYSEYLLHKPEQLILYVLSKQLPKNLLRRGLLKKVDIFRGAEHNLVDKFPNFIPPKPKFDGIQEQDPSKQALRQDTVITYSTTEELPEEFSHLKYEKNPEIEIPFEERNKVFKLTPHNKEVIKQWRSYYHKEKRYVNHKPKAPKSRKPDILTEDVFLRSNRQAARIGAAQYMEENDIDEIEDQTSKAKFFE